MTYGVTIELDSAPDRDVLEAVLDALSRANAAWYGQQWHALEYPPRSAREAGVIWVPDQVSTAAAFATAPVVFERGVASCGPIAAILVGCRQAIEVAQGRSPSSAMARHRVELVEQGPRIWHALARSPWGLTDPVAGMRRRVDA